MLEMTENASCGTVLPQRSGRRGQGFSLVELLVVVAIVALLVSGLVTVGNSVRRAAEKRNTEGTVHLLTLALQEYYEYQNTRGQRQLFPASPYGVWLAEDPKPAEWVDLQEIDFKRYLQTALEGIPSVGTIDPVLYEVLENLSDEEKDILANEVERRAYAEARVSCEVMYATIVDVEACEEILNRLDSSAVVNAERDFVLMQNADPKTLSEVVDAWGQPLRYRTLGRGNMPSVVSAGPDGVFDTADDILGSEL